MWSCFTFAGNLPFLQECLTNRVGPLAHIHVPQVCYMTAVSLLLGCNTCMFHICTLMRRSSPPLTWLSHDLPLLSHDYHMIYPSSHMTLTWSIPPLTWLSHGLSLPSHDYHMIYPSLTWLSCGLSLPSHNCHVVYPSPHMTVTWSTLPLSGFCERPG